MKKIKYNILGLAILVLLGMISCKYDQEVESVISTDGYPVATFTSNVSGTSVNEGDTINVTIALDKALDADITFLATQLDGTADDYDYVATEATVGAYSTDAMMQIIIADLGAPGGEPSPPGVPEESETLKLEIAPTDLGEKYLINPTTVNLVLDLTIVNVNDTSGLTIAYGWTNHDDDIDLLGMYDDVNGWFVDYDYDESGFISWFAAASAANPEVILLTKDDVPGRHLFGIDPFYVSGSTIDYTWSIGYPDQAVEFYTGVFDMDKLDTYPTVNFDAWNIPMYHLMDVELSEAGTYTVTHLNE
jgi:hypothetical protein